MLQPGTRLGPYTVLSAIRRIEDFEWSPDGKRLALSRSRTMWDIVLFRGVD
jgi:hypothetical protein